MKPTHNEVTIVMTKKNALLTGATGFIGAYMLDELMKTKSHAKIFVVIRKVDQFNNPIKRLEEAYGHVLLKVIN